MPPQPFGIYRNLPLMVQGLGMMVLILRDALLARDRTFSWIGVTIFVLYAFYTPVILWVQQTPILGMLMIPKTLAYVAIAIIAYREARKPGHIHSVRVVQSTSTDTRQTFVRQYHQPVRLF